MRAMAIAGDASLDEALGAVRAQPRWQARRSRRRSRRREPYVFSNAGRAEIAVVDYGCKRSILSRLAWAGARGHGLPARRRRGRARPLRRRPALERPRRPRAARRRRRDVRDAARPGAGPRDLPRPPAARARDRPRDVQAPVRPPRREPPGARARRRAACSSRRRTTASRSSPDAVARGDARLALRRHGRGARLRELRARSVQFHPEAGPGPHDAWRDPRDVGRGGERGLPRRPDIESICLIGSGPIVIGQACEFDYAGCQALKVLREDGFRTIVVNSNPATIMTDPGFADRTYLEPLDLEGVAGVLERERPDALLPTMGGQTALNLARAARRGGGARRARRRADRRAGRRDQARRGPRALPRDRPSAGLQVPKSTIVTSARTSLDGLSRCRWSCGRRSRSAGTAAAPRDTPEELERQLERGLAESPIGQVLVEESLLGWDEFELEVDARPRRQRRRSSARSRTSTRWASTPATRSRSRRR